MDYRDLAKDELRHINELRAAEKICQDRLAELTAKLHSMKIPSPQTDPVQGGGNKTEERWLSLIASQMDEERRLKSARRRIKRFNTVWEVLTERDRVVLGAWYIDGGRNCAERVANREHCDVRTAFRWHDEALIRFTRSFYGAVITRGKNNLTRKMSVLCH